MIETNPSDLMTLHEDELIKSAILCLEKRIKYQAVHAIRGSDNASDYLRLQLAPELNEVFAVLFLDTQLRVIAFEKLFYGTIVAVNVYPRVVLQRVMAHNATSVIFAHNHVSGRVDPSNMDIEMTRKLKTILDIVDVVVLDHMIVSLYDSYSFAEHGLL